MFAVTSQTLLAAAVSITLCAILFAYAIVPATPNLVI
ncbi:hypothetical protein Ga0102493_11256 [Erythrobacter litoralis]|jgi:hypothetical protein|nr:enoyl-CoA hydratase [Erythrobacter litoralis]AOL24399.1 hypothetical protein Ga0102493_11256 [Erythrobacter litoralis]MEE4338626.1 enoyl-CoA hydratase [Erythrobacter sp.]